MAVLSLVGKKAVVTGASGGIGFAIASRFAQEGASVVLAGRTRAKLERSLGELQKLGEPRASDRPSQSHRIHCLDVGEMKEWVGLVKEHVGHYITNSQLATPCFCFLEPSPYQAHYKTKSK